MQHVCNPQKKLSWLLGTIMLTLLVQLLFFGKQRFVKDGMVDIKIRDTNLIVPSFYIGLLVDLVLFLAMYTFGTLANFFANGSTLICPVKKKRETMIP